MAELEPVDVTNLDGYGNPPLAWSRARGQLAAPSAGPPPWHLFEITPVAAVAVASAEPYGATRWAFPT